MGISSNPGIYVHIPFCRQKCGYCDFYSVTAFELTKKYLLALQQEIEFYCSKYTPAEPFSSIYIGGGTPSLLEAAALAAILNYITTCFNIDENCEITIEANPGTVDLQKLKALTASGFNRISLGVQSFNNRELKVLERIHDAEQALQSFELSRTAGFNNINIDLISAIPGQTMRSFNSNLQTVLTLAPEHIAVYTLTIEQKTPFYQLLQSGKISTHSHESEREFFDLTHCTLSAAGYMHYEISNYAKSCRFVSAHNYKYWQHIPYLGFGAAAHSFWDNRRWANCSSVHNYIGAWQQGRRCLWFEESLSRDQLADEHLFLNLRTEKGIDLEKYSKIYHTRFEERYDQQIQDLTAAKLAEIKNSNFRLTDKGMVLCDEILLSFK